MINKSEQHTIPDLSEQSCRLLIYSHDTFGLGHLQRCLKIAQALTSAIQNLSVLIATGSSVVHRYEIPDRVDYIKLPSVRKIGPERYESRSLNTPHEQIVSLRASLLLETARHFEPHFILTDHSRIGMKGEMKPTMEFIRNNHPDCHTILGLRDIIDSPERVKASWLQDNIYEDIESYYDSLLIYGDETVYDQREPYGFTHEMKSKASFTGYIADNRSSSSVSLQPTMPRSRPRVVVSVGGGDGATEPIITTFVDMIRRYQDRIDFDCCLIVGPFVPNETFGKYEKDCQELGLELIRFVESTTAYFEASDLVVSTAGYNSVTQILQAAERCLLVPRVMYRQEQFLRASMLEQRGIVQMIHPRNINPDNLYEAVSDALNDKNRPVRAAREGGGIRMDGLERIVDKFVELIETQKEKKQTHV